MLHWTLQALMVCTIMSDLISWKRVYKIFWAVMIYAAVWCHMISYCKAGEEEGVLPSTCHVLLQQHTSATKTGGQLHALIECLRDEFMKSRHVSGILWMEIHLLVLTNMLPDDAKRVLEAMFRLVLELSQKIQPSGKGPSTITGSKVLDFLLLVAVLASQFWQESTAAVSFCRELPGHLERVCKKAKRTYKKCKRFVRRNRIAIKKWCTPAAFFACGCLITVTCYELF